MKKMFKKSISLLVTLLMLCSMMGNVVFAAEEPTINVSTAKCQADGTAHEVTVDVSLANNPGIISMLLEVSYDNTYLKLVGVEDAGILGTNFHGTKDTELAKMPYTLSWGNDTATENITTNGTIVTLKFEVAADAPVDDYEIKVSYNKEEDAILNFDFEPVDFTVNNGAINVVEMPKKDMNPSFKGATYTYDGTVKSLAVTNLPEGAVVTYDTNDVAVAGDWTVTATVTAPGYNDWTGKAVLSIKPKTITIDGLKAENKTYDGTTTATITGGTLKGVIEGDDVTVVIPEYGTFIKKDVGSSLAVNFDEIILEGKDKDNYTLSKPAGLKANITKASLKVKADDLTMIKGEAIPELTYKIVEGKLFEGDGFTGALKTSADGKKVGTFDILQGTFKTTATANYNLTFVKGTLTVVDKPVPNVVVTELPAAVTYGDAPIEFTATPDADAELATDIVITSSNPDVADYVDGAIIIKAAGTADITVSQEGNEEYASFTNKQTLKVNKKAITVKAIAAGKKEGSADPELEYDVVGELVEGDEFTGALARKEGEAVGEYDILLGTLAVNDNYAITFETAVFTIFDKTPQNIDVTLPDATYGDAPVAVTVTPDADSKLDDFAFASSNPAVATISETEGVITIVGAGETEITVSQAGNVDYAAFEGKYALVVNKKAATVESVDLIEKTAVLAGIVEGDTAVELDLEKVTLEIIEEDVVEPENPEDPEGPVDTLNLDDPEGSNDTEEPVNPDDTEEPVNPDDTEDPVNPDDTEDPVNPDDTEEPEVIVNVLVKNFVLKGEKSENYVVTTESVESTIAKSNIVSVAITATNGTVTGAANYIKGSNVTVVATPDSGYKFNGWFIDTTSVSSDATYTFVAEADVALIAKFSKKSSGGSGGGGGGSVKPPVKEEPKEEVTEPTTPTTPVTPSTTAKFADVKENDWFFAYVTELAEKGIVSGNGNGSFAPNNNVTREQFLKMLLEATDIEAVAAENTFADVADDWYTEYVLKAKALGIVNGVSDTTFGIGENITRQDMAVMITRVIEKASIQVESKEVASFEDNNMVADYAVNAVEYMKSIGLIEGYNNQYRPNDNLTRAEAAKVIVELLKLI